jgi:hypothetical protein
LAGDVDPASVVVFGDRDAGEWFEVGVADAAVAVPDDGVVDPVGDDEDHRGVESSMSTARMVRWRGRSDVSDGAGAALAGLIRSTFDPGGWTWNTVGVGRISGGSTPRR